MSQTPTIRHFEGGQEYETAVDELLAHAQSRIVVFEPQLSASYNSLRRQEVLRAFILSRRDTQIRILVHDASNIVRYCARLCQLLRQYAHAVHIHETSEEARRIYDPFCVVDHTCYARRFHHEDLRGITSMDDEGTAQELIRRFDEMWDLSRPAVGATVLGL